jgi:hypothetical protein
MPLSLNYSGAVSRLIHFVLRSARAGRGQSGQRSQNEREPAMLRNDDNTTFVSSAHALPRRYRLSLSLASSFAQSLFKRSIRRLVRGLPGASRLVRLGRLHCNSGSNRGAVARAVMNEVVTFAPVDLCKRPIELKPELAVQWPLVAGRAVRGRIHVGTGFHDDTDHFRRMPMVVFQRMVEE